jgi:predicted amidohydrolase
MEPGFRTPVRQPRRWAEIVSSSSLGPDRAPRRPPRRCYPPAVPTAVMSVALVREVFFGVEAGSRLTSRLGEARARGADLAILPELPLDPWVPASDAARDEDAEAAEGPRRRLLCEAARSAGIGLVGGAIVRDPVTGQRHNTALVISARGALIGVYRKIHLPDETGFWEGRHYVPSAVPPEVFDGVPLRLGVQLCSDVNRPQGSHILAAAGAEVIAVPRATEAATFDAWRLVLRATALTSAAYIVSVPRPDAEQGLPLGGPSIAIAPDGSVLLETTDPVAVIALERAAVQEARRTYPGYLPIVAGIYAEGWSRLKGG